VAASSAWAASSVAVPESEVAPLAEQRQHRLEAAGVRAQPRLGVGRAQDHEPPVDRELVGQARLGARQGDQLAVDRLCALIPQEGGEREGAPAGDEKEQQADLLGDAGAAPRGEPVPVARRAGWGSGHVFRRSARRCIHR